MQIPLTRISLFRSVVPVLRSRRTEAKRAPQIPDAPHRAVRATRIDRAPEIETRLAIQVIAQLEPRKAAAWRDAAATPYAIRTIRCGMLVSVYA
jgi:hypothetical protein